MSDYIELNYAAKIVKDGDGYLVTFRDIKNAYTGGDTLEEAICNAQEVLDLMILDLIEKNGVVPSPSKARKKEVLISPSPDVAAPALLHILRNDRNRTLTQVAKRMGVPYQSYQRMESGKNLTLKSMRRAASALDAFVEIRLRKLA